MFEWVMWHLDDAFFLHDLSEIVDALSIFDDLHVQIGRVVEIFCDDRFFKIEVHWLWIVPVQTLQSCNHFIFVNNIALLDVLVDRIYRAPKVSV